MFSFMILFRPTKSLPTSFWKNWVTEMEEKSYHCCLPFHYVVIFAMMPGKMLCEKLNNLSLSTNNIIS